MKTILRSQDFSCPTCVEKIETRLQDLVGVSKATVHFSTGRIEVHHDAQQTPVTELVTAVRELGYDAKPSPF